MHYSYSNQSFIKQSSKSPKPQKPSKDNCFNSNQYFNSNNSNDNDITNYHSDYRNILKHQSQMIQSPSTNPRSIQKLNKKIKQIKSALKIAQQHNQQLHNKINQQKKVFFQQRQLLEIQINKYKSLYQMLIQNYETRSLQLKQAKKKIKKYQKHQSKLFQLPNYKQNHIKSQQDNHLCNSENKIPQYVQQLLTQQQVNLQHLKHQTKLLKQEIILKNRKITEYQILFQAYQSQSRMNQMNSNHKNSQEFIELNKRQIFLQQELQKHKKQKQLSSTKIKRLQVELESTRHIKQTIQKQDIKLKKQNQQLKLDFIIKEKSFNQFKDDREQNKWKGMYQEVSQKYNEILRFSYEIQKDFQRELHTMAKQLTRREIVKNVQSQ